MSVQHPDAEIARKVGNTFRRLKMAMEGVWEARNDGDKDALAFFQQSVVTFAKALSDAIKCLVPKEGG